MPAITKISLKITHQSRFKSLPWANELLWDKRRKCHRLKLYELSEHCEHTFEVLNVSSSGSLCCRVACQIQKSIQIRKISNDILSDIEAALDCSTVKLWQIQHRPKRRLRPWNNLPVYRKHPQPTTYMRALPQTWLVFRRLLCAS